MKCGRNFCLRRTIAYEMWVIKITRIEYSKQKYFFRKYVFKQLNIDYYGINKEYRNKTTMKNSSLTMTICVKEGKD